MNLFMTENLLHIRIYSIINGWSGYEHKSCVVLFLNQFELLKLKHNADLLLYELQLSIKRQLVGTWLINYLILNKSIKSPCKHHLNPIQSLKTLLMRQNE